MKARLREWKAQVEVECRKNLVRIRIDNGEEFKSNSLMVCLKLKGVKQEFTPPRSPQSNGVAERMNMNWRLEIHDAALERKKCQLGGDVPYKKLPSE